MGPVVPCRIVVGVLSELFTVMPALIGAQLVCAALPGAAASITLNCWRATGWRMCGDALRVKFTFWSTHEEVVAHMWGDAVSSS
jgi:hypothetical protein